MRGESLCYCFLKWEIRRLIIIYSDLLCSRVQPHLKKCFEGVNSLDFGDDLEVVAVRSSEGEVIALTQIISTAKARGQVEKWLVQLEASVKSSIKKVKYHPKNTQMYFLCGSIFYTQYTSNEHPWKFIFLLFY